MKQRLAGKAGASAPVTPAAWVSDFYIPRKVFRFDPLAGPPVAGCPFRQGAASRRLSQRHVRVGGRHPQRP